MAVLVPYSGRQQLLSMIVSQFSSGSVFLYRNDYVPTNLSNMSNFVKCDFSGNPELTPSWGSVLLDGSNRAYSVSSTMTFQSWDSGMNSQYGYGWVLQAWGSVIAAERFASPKFFGQMGDFLNLAITIRETQG